ncbi:hypothetical protein DPMN_113347 [Dreissena polymorpha]|uniref:Uncharacterized protein n=1 Tax=Dreissena polymorpha TaxID=45954 RepID=A0A9D4KIJ6_DREPO|nr:hypothetical protein DPMN_113347 [Dreissena polymorpha]
MCTPLEETEGWKMSVIALNGTIYMCQIGANTVPDQSADLELWRKSFGDGNRKSS